MDFKIGDKVQVTGQYPADKDYPFPHTDDTQFWGLQGTVVASEFGYIDDKYVFVQPLGVFTNNWPNKEKFDPLSYWHFLEEEVRKI